MSGRDNWVMDNMTINKLAMNSLLLLQSLCGELDNNNNFDSNFVNEIAPIWVWTS